MGNKKAPPKAVAIPMARFTCPRCYAINTVEAPRRRLTFGDPKTILPPERAECMRCYTQVALDPVAFE